MTRSAFVIRMLKLGGETDDVQIVKRLNWTGKAIVFPRTLFQRIRKLPEFNRPGVYVLVLPSGECELPILYIGKEVPVPPRVEKHKGKEDCCLWGVFFTSGDASLNKVHIQYLESELMRLAKDSGRVCLENVKLQPKPSILAADEAEAASFLRNMLGIFPILGIHAFAKAPSRKKSETLLFLSGKGITGRGFETSSGFVVLKGSAACKSHTPSLWQPAIKRREALLRSGVLVDEGTVLRLTQDNIFSSASVAASALLATPTNGRRAWKDENGISLNKLDELVVIKSKTTSQ